jgi:hypothetical protein
MKIENIKFKAKELGTGKWKVGFLQRDMDYNLCILIANKEDHSWYWTQIDPSTVCMFTGLKDCEGKEIWEGDTLSNVTDDSPAGIVVFKYGAFSLLAKNGRDFCIALTYLLSEKDSLNRFKVVGNKFDKEK